MKISIPKLTEREGRYGYFIRIKNPATGKRTWKSLGTDDEKEATKEAQRICLEQLKLQDDRKEAAKALDKTAKRNDYATVGDVIEVYLDDHERACKRSSARQNSNSLLLLLREAGIKNPEKARLNVLDAKLVRTFRRARLENFERETDEYDSAVITINGIYRKAKSLFSRKQLAEDGAYSDLKLPDLSGFLGVPFLKEDKDDYTFIGKTLFSNLLNDATRLSQEDPELYAAFLIASTTGLRKNEIIHARWDWLKVRNDGTTVISIPGKERFEGVTFTTKSGKGRDVPIAEGVISELRRLAVKGYRADYLLPTENLTARNDKVWRRFSAWFESCGIKRRKCAHECRKFFGSQVATNHGIYVACKLLGHSSVDVTERYYADLVKPAPVPDVALPPHLKEQQVQKISAS